MADQMILKLHVILKMSKVSLKEIRTWEREKIRRRIFEIALKKYWLYEPIIHDAKKHFPQCVLSHYCN